MEVKISKDAVCPVCKTSEDRETVLVPTPGEEDIMPAVIVHKTCYASFLQMDPKEPQQ